MSMHEVHTELTALLGLDQPPVAISFHGDAPVGVAEFAGPMSEPTEDGRAGRVPAGCVFWAYGHTETFATAPEDHGNCSVGRFTHGFAQAGDIVDKFDVGTLLDLGWVTLDAFDNVAALPEAPGSVVYGPLAEAANVPDVVLLRVSPRQMMEIADAVDVEFSSKPQCQIVPRAAAGTISASMGCALSRERIGMGDDELTCAVPGSELGRLVTSLREVCRSDAAVVGYAAADKQRF